MTKLPKIQFSQWHKWEMRNKIDNANLPGVYLLAKFKIAPKKVAILDRRILYIGETCAGLKSRWRQFNRSAFQGKPGHSGGNSYRCEIGDRGKNLYVSAMPISLDKNVEHVFIRYLERKLILDFTLKNKIQPRLNKK